MPPLPSPTEALRRPGRPRDEGRDRAILEATLDLLCRDGLAGLTVDAVAAAAGASKATIYRRWASKEAMVLDAWRELSQAVEVPDTGVLRDDLLALYQRFAERISVPPLSKVLPHMVAVAQVDEQFGREYREFISERRRPLRTILERAIARGEVPAEVEPELVQELLSGPIYFRALFSGRRVPPRHVERIVDVVLAGLGASSTVCTLRDNRCP